MAQTPFSPKTTTNSKPKTASPSLESAIRTLLSQGQTDQNISETVTNILSAIKKEEEAKKKNARLSTYKENWSKAIKKNAYSLDDALDLLILSIAGYYDEETKDWADEDFDEVRSAIKYCLDALIKNNYYSFLKSLF